MRTIGGLPKILYPLFLVLNALVLNAVGVSATLPSCYIPASCTPVYAPLAFAQLSGPSIFVVPSPIMIPAAIGNRPSICPRFKAVRPT